MPTFRSYSLATIVALGAVALSATSAALAQGFTDRYGGYVDYDDEGEYGGLVPPRPIPDYRRSAVETVVTTTRRVVTSRAPDYELSEPDADIAVRRVIVSPPVRRSHPADVVVTTGSLPPRPYYLRPPVYKSEPVYAPAPVLREEFITARPRGPVQPVIIEERRVETTRRILAPAPLD